MIQGVRILSQDQPFDERDVWSLLAGELSCLPGMTDAGRLGFAIQLKFRQTYGHYPESISELPSGMVRVTAEQIGGCVALTEVSQQKLRRLFFRQPTDKIVPLRTIHHRVDDDTALCVSSVPPRCLSTASALVGTN